jgi:SH3-like domain-containing protein
MMKTTIAPLALCCATLLGVPGTASALCVKVEKANLRQGPGTRFEKSWQVYEYMPLKKIGRRGDWYKVADVDGDTHWVHRKLVTDSMHCAVVKVDSANVRSGPGTGYAKSPLSPVGRYYSFKVIGRKGAWVKVRDELFAQGWMARKLLWVR